MNSNKEVFKVLRQIKSKCHTRFIIYKNPITDELRVFTKPTVAQEPNPNVNNFYNLEGVDVTDLVKTGWNKFTPNGVFDERIWLDEISVIGLSRCKFPAHWDWQDIS